MHRSHSSSGRPATPADFNRNSRPTSIVMGGRLQSECPADIIGIRNHDRRIFPLGARAFERSKATPRRSRLGAREGSEIEHLGRELTPQVGDTAGSQYGFRRRGAPNADLCARISAVGSVTPRGACFGVKLSCSWHPANGRFPRNLVARAGPGEGPQSTLCGPFEGVPGCR
jgi:hypothetical protein